MMKKLIDERGRLFGKVSVIDVFVLLAVVILAIAAFTKFNVYQNPLTSDNTVDIVYTLEIPAIRYSNANIIRPGDKVYSLETGANIGTVMAVEIRDAYAIEDKADGAFVIARVHERYDVFLTVEAHCSYSNGRLYADRTFELNANAEYKIYTKYNEFAKSLIRDITLK
jgi:hypothetical protein